MEDSAVAMLDSAGATHSPHPRVGSVAVAPIVEAGLTVEAGHSTAVAAITAAEDIMAQVSDLASAFMRLTDMPPPAAVPPGSMMRTACGNIIPVAPCPTDISLNAPNGRRSSIQDSRLHLPPHLHLPPKVSQAG